MRVRRIGGAGRPGGRSGARADQTSSSGFRDLPADGAHELTSQARDMVVLDARK
jgi:hypothetical protein